MTVASNLYLHTVPEAEESPAPLQFSLPDSRYRYLVFCVSTAVTAALVYDEKKKIEPENLMTTCLHLVMQQIPEIAQLLGFKNGAIPQESIANCPKYFRDFLKHWSQWPELEKQKRYEEIEDLICLMVHTTESAEPLSQIDKERLGRLALEISCRMPTMHGAFVELASR